MDEVLQKCTEVLPRSSFSIGGDQEDIPGRDEIKVSGTMTLFDYNNNVMKNMTVEIVDDTNASTSSGETKTIDSSMIGESFLCENENKVEDCFLERSPLEIIVDEPVVVMLSMESSIDANFYDQYWMEGSCGVLFKETVDTFDDDVALADLNVSDAGFLEPISTTVNAFASMLTIESTKSIINSCTFKYCSVICSIYFEENQIVDASVDDGISNAPGVDDGISNTTGTAGDGISNATGTVDDGISDGTGTAGDESGTPPQGIV